jgi:hypothetical protein
LTIVEVTIPWNDVEIHLKKFSMNEDKKYTQGPFKIQNIRGNTLDEAREKKVKKYENIVGDIERWLKDNEEEIKINHHVQGTSVNCRYIIISNLGVIRRKSKKICASN